MRAEHRFGPDQESDSKPSVLPERFAQYANITGTLGEIAEKLGVKDRLLKVAELFALDFEKQAIVKPSGERVLFLRIEMAYEKRLTFRGEKLELISYVRSPGDPDEFILPNLTHKDAVDRDEARRTAQAVVNALEIDEDLGQCPGDLDDHWTTTGKENDLVGANWTFDVFRRYQGIEGAGFVSVMVSAYSGIVRGFSQMPVIPPETMEVKVDEAQARDIVVRFARERGIEIDTITVKDKFITIPTPGIWAKPGEEAPAPDFEHPRLAYRVFAYSPREGDPEEDMRVRRLLFGVDCYTGEVIGGSRGI